VQATGLIEYDAGNRLLVVGDDPVLVERAVRTAGTSLQASALVILAADDAWRAPIAGVTTWYVTRADIDLHGWLGAFRLRLSSQGDGEARFDQVLDLCALPLLGTELPPPGYLTGDETDIEDRIEALGDLVGQFEKPKYFRYNADSCAHGMKGATACTRCIDACPAGAITSLVERVRVEPHLCQGGGACATACPTGAMTYGYPRVEDSLERVRRMLRTYQDAGGEAPLLLIHDNEGGAELAQALMAADDEMASRLLPLAVEEVASLGLEAWLTALAYGASAIWLMDRPGIPRVSRAVVDEQLALAESILSGMGYPSGVLAWVAPSVGSDQAGPPREFASATAAQPISDQISGLDADRSTAANCTPAPMPSIGLARHAAIGDKRQILFQAIDHLYAQSPNRDAPVDTALELPAGAPFGTTLVNKQACTLCMACVTVCPAKALQPGQDVPQLRFRESNCVQCGLCEQSCPERAISISPRLLLDTDARNVVRLLNEDAPFHCLSCGSAFATKAVIGRMEQRLADHSMFSTPAARRRLQLCGDCRVADMMQAGEL
jgi:ferredoxin